MEGSECIAYSYLHSLSETSPYWLHLWSAAFYGKVWKDPIISILCNGINTEYSCIYKCKMYVLKSGFIIMTVKKDWLGILLLNTVSFMSVCQGKKNIQIHKYVCVCGFMYVCRPQDFLRGRGVMSLKKMDLFRWATQGKRCFSIHVPSQKGHLGVLSQTFLKIGMLSDAFWCILLSEIQEKNIC